VDLVFDREVFAYPTYERRDPFRPLTGAETGPRFEDLVLRGRILDAVNPRASVALIESRAAGGTQQQAGRQTYRVRVGDVIGNARIVEIRESQVVAEVEDFGVVELRTLQLVRAAPSVSVPGIAAPPASGGQVDAGQGGTVDGADTQGTEPPLPPAVGMRAGSGGNPWIHSRVVNGGTS
jgi:hypothetical protein